MNAKDIFIKEIKENTRIESLFLVKEKHSGMTRGGKPYLALVLSDKTGEVKGRIWDNADTIGELFSQGDVIRVRAYAILYQNDLQLNITGVEKHADEETTARRFLPASKTDPGIYLESLMSYVATITIPHVRTLLEAVFQDPDIAAAFTSAPAAKSLHHDYIGGLAEHTLNVTRLADDVVKHYNTVNRDLLLAGAMLHDIGKIHELAYTRNFEYTDSGRLIGHITMGVEIINTKINAMPDFPSDLALIIKHLILSHHGQYEFGSPRRPKTLEAVMLGYLDDLDSKMGGLARFIKHEKRSDTPWTSYHRNLDRYFYTGTYIDNDEGSDDQRYHNKDAPG